MKKCLQCGNKFDDKFSFCPECGQQLVADNSCPQCGAEIAPGAKFCPNCGARLAPQAAPQAAPAPQQPAPAPAPVYAAPQPAPAPAPAPAPVYAAPQPAPQQRPARQKGEVLQKVLRFVYLGLFCLFSFLFLLGMFGDPFQANAMGYTQGQSISYFFGEGLEPYSDVSTAGQGFSMFMTVLYMLSYFGALIGLCICIPIGIVKVTKAVKAKAPIDTKMLSGMVVSVVPYLFLTGAVTFYKQPYGQVEFGWGTTMIFVMVILSVVTMTVYKVFGGKLNVKEIIANSLCGVGYLAAVLMAVFSNTLLVSVSQYGTTYDYTLYSRVLEHIDAADAFEAFPILMIGFMLSLVSAGLMIGSVNAPKSRRLGRVIPMLVIATVLNMTACILGGMALNDLYGGMYDIIPGMSVGSIMTIVLFIVELGSVIAAVSVAKPSNPAPMQPQPQPLPQPQDPNQGYRG